jgi:hypothetical protein
MSLLEIVDKNQLDRIEKEIKKDCIEFKKLPVGSKAKAADQLYIENRILKELGVAAVDTIERMDEEIEIKDNKINIMEKQLKEVNHYDESKIFDLLNKKPIIRNNKRERAKRQLINTLSSNK